jgi:hypothetical protein
MVTLTVVHEWMSQANLVIFVVILSVLIILSIFVERRKKFVWHGNSMLVVFMVAILLTIIHMGPYFIRAVGETLNEFNGVALLGIIHGAAGLATILIGVWLLSGWFLSESSGEIRFCAPRKKLMRKISILWVIALGLGIAYYLLHLIFT